MASPFTGLFQIEDDSNWMNFNQSVKENLCQNDERKTNYLLQGLIIHTHVIKSEILFDNCVATALTHMFMKFGHIKHEALECLWSSSLVVLNWRPTQVSVWYLCWLISITFALFTNFPSFICWSWLFCIIDFNVKLNISTISLLIHSLLIHCLLLFYFLSLNVSSIPLHNSFCAVGTFEMLSDLVTLSYVPFFTYFLLYDSILIDFLFS